MIKVERNGCDWIVTQDGCTISVHPSRQEAERALAWLHKDAAVEPDTTNNASRGSEGAQLDTTARPSRPRSSGDK